MPPSTAPASCHKNPPNRPSEIRLNPHGIQRSQTVTLAYVSVTAPELPPIRRLV
jgi:hypothetical protein